MKFTHLVFSLFIFMLAFSLIILSSCSSDSGKSSKVINQILMEQLVQIPDSVTQLVLVCNENLNDSQANLFTLKKEEEKWIPVLNSIPAGIGENGFAASGQKVEGDGKSPTGLFKLGQLFTYEKEVDTRMPFIQSTSEDKWIDDPDSPDYNRHVRGKTSAKSYENLKLTSIAYKYCMVIEYNTNPVVKEKGSAIFFHLRNSETGTTAGCVAISESEMLQILKWLDPSKHPMILMGNADALIKPEAISAK